jgi:toxin ParE1/3/4
MALRFLATANADMKSIYDWIAETTNQPSVAEAFVLRIFDRCEQLIDFPEIGVARDDLSPGIRLLPFERRATVFYRIVGTEVQVTNVFYRGRDYDDSTFS